LLGELCAMRRLQFESHSPFVFVIAVHDRGFARMATPITHSTLKALAMSAYFNSNNVSNLAQMWHSEWAKVTDGKK
jgi:hypothetical protein